MKSKNKVSAKARSPESDITCIPEIYDRTVMAIDCIDRLSGYDPEVSKAIASCATIGIYVRQSEVDDPYLIADEMYIDHVRNIYHIGEMLDDGTWTERVMNCPHVRDCGDSCCDTCMFAQLRTIDMSRLRESLAADIGRIPVRTN